MGSRLTAQQRSQIAEALFLSRCLLNSGNSEDEHVRARRRDRLREIQQALQACAHPITLQADAPQAIPMPVRCAFVKAALLVSRYFVVGGGGWRGTLASPSLANYHPDPVPSSWSTPAGLTELGDRFALPATLLDSLLRELEQVDAEIVRQRHVIEAVLQSVSVDAAADTFPAREPFVSLFQELFGGLLINPDRLEVVFTPTQLYFCIDFPPVEEFRAWANLSPPEYQTALKELHQTLSNFSFQKFKRFPTFGPCNPANINFKWAQQVCDRLNHRLDSAAPYTPEQIVQRLSTSVGVLPLKDAEMFLVHDIWGHYWQLLFSQFASDYATLADCGEALRAHETAYTAQGPLTCRELFHFDGVDVKLQIDRAVQFFHGEVRQRLGLLFTHLLGELVADIAEFKFTWTNPKADHQLPSSSAFTDYPANLDLSLADLDFLFLRVLQPLLEVQLSALATSPLELELLADPQLEQLDAAQMPQLEVNLKRAIAQLYHLFLTEYGRCYLPSLAAEDSLFAEIAVNLLYLQNVINSLYTDPQLTSQTALPFQDLLIVFISCYCSGDSYAEFWQIDNVLADYFVPCWQLLHPTAKQSESTP